MIITNSTSDEFYLNQLLAFLTSMSINSPEHTITVFLADYPESLKINLEHKFPNYTFENRKVKKIDDRGFSMILFRIEAIKECFEEYKTNVAWIDTDVIVRKNLNSFLNIESNQLKILYRKDERFRPGVDSPINAGILNIGYSDDTYNFVCKWLSGCESNKQWGQGQRVLWNTYKKFSDKIDLLKMSKSFNDLGGRPEAFDDTSVMWHCKKNHFKNEKFQKEFKFYLGMCKNENI